jgi:predicted CoA-binding protein
MIAAPCELIIAWTRAQVRLVDSYLEIACAEPAEIETTIRDTNNPRILCSNLPAVPHANNAWPLNSFLECLDQRSRFATAMCEVFLDGMRILLHIIRAIGAAGLNHDNYSDEYISGILNSVKTIALLGASANTVRPSYFVLKYLLDKGYNVIPVNPGLAGKEILGQAVFAGLADVLKPFDMVDIFRPVALLPKITDEILALEYLPSVVWMQLRIRDDECAARLENAGIKVVMNRCPKIEYARLSREIGWNGVNSRIISSRKPLVRDGYQSLGIRKP